MKYIIRYVIISVLIIDVFLISCKKEKSCEGCIDKNKPPIAIAGPDQVIILPIDSASLDGSASNDPDGTISDWQWTKISGPGLSNIINSKTSKPTAKSLVVGVYQLELKVTDNKGAVGKDTLNVTVVTSSPNNRPPIANAGPDQNISLPSSGLALDGSNSSDPDNNIISYSWSRISGPSSSITLNNTSSVQAQVVGAFVSGNYQFELKVTDAGGLYDMDTMQVIVSGQPPPPPSCNNINRPIVNAQMIPIGILSQARGWMTTASTGNKILFAGGTTDVQYSSRVDIYDIPTNTWSTAELCAGRYLMAAATSGNKVFFGGGETGDGTWPVDSVDIYDASTNTWTVFHLGMAGNQIAAAAVGDKVIFAGGDGGFAAWERFKKVDIFNLSTNTWTYATLSEEKRGGHVAVTVGDKLYVAGGETMIQHGSTSWEYNWKASNVVDIYDNSTNTWSTSTMLEGKLQPAGIAVGGKIVWAGGLTGSYPDIYPSCNVEIKDINAGTSTMQQLFNPATWLIDAGQNVVLSNNKLIFYRANGSDMNKFDIYDLSSNTWSIGVLPQAIPSSASIIAVNNTIYVAGGNTVGSTQVWKLVF